jgi:hypothetical protein
MVVVMMMGTIGCKIWYTGSSMGKPWHHHRVNIILTVGDVNKL